MTEQHQKGAFLPKAPVRVRPSPSFLRLTRNPDLASPTRFERLPEIEGVVKL